MDILYITLLTLLGTGVIGLLVGKLFFFAKEKAAKTENKIDDALIEMVTKHQDDLVKYLEVEAEKFLKKKLEDEKKDK